MNIEDFKKRQEERERIATVRDDVFARTKERLETALADAKAHKDDYPFTFDQVMELRELLQELDEVLV